MTETSRAVLYLDIDGVVNAEMPQGWGPSQMGYAVGDGRRYRMRWGRDLIAALNELDLDIIVASTWRQWGETEVFPLMGLKAPVYVLHPDLDPGAGLIWPSIDWKMQAIRQHQALHPSPFVHIDDEIVHEQFWPRVVEDMGGLAIGPYGHIGITRTHIAQIQTYLASRGITNDADTVAAGVGDAADE